MSEEMIEKVARAIHDSLDLSDGLKLDMAMGGEFTKAAEAAVSAYNPNERRCLTCGAQDPRHNEFCSDGFHAPGETYWPVDPNERLREAASAIIERMSSTYRARNGREMGIQGEDGEKCWIVHSDDIEALRSALSPLPQVEDS